MEIQGKSIHIWLPKTHWVLIFVSQFLLRESLREKHPGGAKQYLNKLLERQAVIFKRKHLKRHNQCVPSAQMGLGFHGPVFPFLPWESVSSKCLHTDQGARTVQAKGRAGCYLTSMAKPASVFPGLTRFIVNSEVSACLVLDVGLISPKTRALLPLR